MQIGDVVAERTVHLTREALVRYAGASGDFNPIHYRDDVAARVGLPGVLAHGMLTMGLAVETEDGAEVTVVAKVGAVDDDTARIDLTVAHGGTTVLGKAQVRVRR